MRKMLVLREKRWWSGALWFQISARSFASYAIATISIWQIGTKITTAYFQIVIFLVVKHNKRLAHTITVTVCKASSATMRNSIFECQNTNKQTTMYTITTFIGRLPSVRLVSITFSKAQTTITISKIYYKHRNSLKYGKLRARVCFCRYDLRLKFIFLGFSTPFRRHLSWATHHSVESIYIPTTTLRSFGNDFWGDQNNAREMLHILTSVSCRQNEYTLWNRFQKAAALRPSYHSRI